MLDDELELLDGTPVLTIGAIARRSELSDEAVARIVEDCLPAETSLGGVRYYRRDVALPLIAALG